MSQEHCEHSGISWNKKPLVIEITELDIPLYLMRDHNGFRCKYQITEAKGTNDGILVLHCIERKKIE